jgi:phage terminase large subunit-like protein
MCPELFSAETLKMRREEMGSLSFEREFRLKRIDHATAPFKRQYEMLYTELPLRFQRIVTVCDPAYSENQGDYSAIVTVGFTGGNHAYVLEAKAIRREDPGIVVDELVKTIKAHKPQAVGIEKRKGQAIHYSFQEARARNRLWDFKYVELLTHGLSKDKRINMVGGLVARWEAHCIHIHPDMGLLRSQLIAYRFDDRSTEHDDLVDALAYSFHPDMTYPNSGPSDVPLDAETASIEGKPRYQVGQGEHWMPRDVPQWATNNVSLSKAMASMLDKRVGDAR